jgi:hypothetical protein
VIAIGMIMLMLNGQHASFASLVPSLVVMGAGMGIMNVPMTNAVMDNTPEAQTGIASALLNDAREVAGLLGIAVVGAVLRSSQSSALRTGSSAPQAFVDGYHNGILIAAILCGVGVVISYALLRPGKNSVPSGSANLSTP